MGTLAVVTARPAAFALAPVIAAQGTRLRRRIPVLSEAEGQRDGTVGAGPQPPLRLLVVGESTAAGVGVSHQRDALAVCLAEELARARDCEVGYQISARTGATVRDTLSQLVPAAQGRADLAVVVLGVNDTLRLRSRRSWRRCLEEVVDALAPKLSEHGEIVLCGVPDFGSMPALPQPLRAILRWHGRALDMQMRRVAVAAGKVAQVRCVPTPPDLPRAYFAVDGFHPNADGYAAWARHLMLALGPAGGSGPPTAAPPAP